MSSRGKYLPDAFSWIRINPAPHLPDAISALALLATMNVLKTKKIS
jgi:hypothetical protein